MSETAMEVSDDALKLLVAEHGVRGTARLLGMDETQAETFRKRVSRAGWVREPAMMAIRESSGVPMAGRSSVPIVPKMSPIQAIQAELSQLGQQTRVSIARGIAKAGKHIESMDGQEIVLDAQNVKAIAQTASTVHSWDRQGGAPKIRLELLANKSEVAALEIESEVVTDDWADDY